jgi:hypothetical protein
VQLRREDQSYGHRENVINIEPEARRHFKNKKRECLRNKINYLGTDSKNEHVVDLTEDEINLRMATKLKRTL